MHPNGDELILVLSGRLDLILETASTCRTETVQTGQFIVVPKGVWHTADVPEPGRALFITAGEGTQHRERSPGY
ncbi:cupin domain protein [Asticcacaulis biprosthecium C19]|uniref:Cupin domain protein n=2 Tax=Asticcacaulis biprosthecium TaxID=76891 RepID=F4QRD0_9CAUL|nr:cupin domain protein [Asticcacaulis biprosthecium C19]